MNALLVQISVAIGFLLFIISLLIGLVCGVNLTTAIFRSAMISMLSCITATLFFRFFAKTLYRFIAEQQRLKEEQEQQEREKEEQEKKQHKRQQQQRQAVPGADGGA